MTIPSPGFTLRCGEGVAEVLRHADQMIKQVRTASGGGTCDRVAQMELSLLRSLRMIVDLAAGAGEVHIAKDSCRSLTFVAPRLGLEGAMIFHPDDQVAGTPVVGEWTLHS